MLIDSAEPIPIQKRAGPSGMRLPNLKQLGMVTTDQIRLDREDGQVVHAARRTPRPAPEPIGVHHIKRHREAGDLAMNAGDGIRSLFHEGG